MIDRVKLGFSASEALPEVASILLATLSGGVAAWLIQLRRQRRGDEAATFGWRARSLEALVLLVPFAASAAVLIGAQLALSGPRPVLGAVLRLTLASGLIRLSLYLLRLWLGPDSLLRAWELRLTFLFGLIVALQLLGGFTHLESALNTVDFLPGQATFTLWDLARGLVVLASFLFVTVIVARTVERRVMALGAIAASTRLGISKFSYFFLMTLGLLLSINAAGIDLTALTVITGALGVGLGFGLQAITSNFVTGFVLLADKSIKPGDVISFTGTTGTSTENFGWVQELRGRYVVVQDRDGVETLVPNQNLITTPVINWSYSDRRVRLKLPVRIGYEEDLELALRTLAEAVRDIPRVLREPAPAPRLMSFEDYGMCLELRFWISDPMNGVNNVRSDVNRAVWRLFKERGIKIPVAQVDVRLLGEKGAG